MSTQEFPLVTEWRHHKWVIPLVIVCGLVAILYAPVISGLLRQWYEDPNYSHGFVVPLFSVFLLWMDRSRLLKIPLKPSNLGLVGIAGSIVLLILGSLAAELFVSRMSFLILLWSIVVFFAGWQMLRSCAFPLGFLVFMIPLPAIIYYQITFPLQLLASWFAGVSLDLLQVPALRDGNIIVLPNYTMEVAEACSGIRSLFSLLAVACAYTHLTERSNWKRVLLVVLMIPIAILSNGLRIVGTGVLTYLYGQRYAEGFFHMFAGWMIFLTAFVFLLFAHRLIALFGRRKEVR